MTDPNLRRGNPIDGAAAAFNQSNLFPFPSPPQPKILRPLAPQPILSLSLPPESTHPDSATSSPGQLRGGVAPGFPSTVRISSLGGGGGKGGPAFVGQVFSMCDLSGTGLMAVSTHFDIPFISKRTPEWIKKIFTTVGKRERNGPVFRFFMDLGDAVSYVRRLNIPSGVVGACRLDLAFEHFKEKPHLFQFVPNEKQVKEANKLLKTMPRNGGKKKVDGVPVFSSQNLDIAIATMDGIKWYTPYFFDKKMLDNILEDSVDQHFQSMIQTRNLHRRKDVFDENLTSEMTEENGENMWEPPEVQEVLEEVGLPGIPLSVVSKAAEIQLLYAVDKVLLGNRWLRKAAGIQPKFPYMVESFEKRSATSLLRATESASSLTDSESDQLKQLQLRSPMELAKEHNVQSEQVRRPNFQFPFGDWFRNPWSKQQNRCNQSERRMEYATTQELESSPFLPKITMVGISTGEAGQLSKAKLKKTMDDLTRELEQTDQADAMSTYSKHVDRDPLFVSNVGDYYPGISRGGSSRFVRGGIN